MYDIRYDIGYCRQLSIPFIVRTLPFLSWLPSAMDTGKLKHLLLWLPVPLISTASSTETSQGKGPSVPPHPDVNLKKTDPSLESGAATHGIRVL